MEAGEFDMKFHFMTLCDMCAKTSLYHVVPVGVASKKSCDVCRKRKIVMLYRVSGNEQKREEIGED